MSEQLVNEHFNDFPIDYFKIEKEDFVLAYGASTENPNISDNQYQNQLSTIRKTIIEPDENGRIFNSLNLVLNLDENDTTVINSSVGQGKTYSILKTVETYFNQHPDTYIFMYIFKSNNCFNMDFEIVFNNHFVFNINFYNVIKRNSMGI